VGRREGRRHRRDADTICSITGISIVWTLNLLLDGMMVKGGGGIALNVVSAHILGFLTDYSGVEGFHVSLSAPFYLLKTTSVHVECKIHVVIDCFVN